MTNLTLTETEVDALLAAIRMLQTALEGHGPWPVSPDDGDIGDILTNSGAHKGATVADLERVIARFYSGCADPDVIEQE